MRCSRCHSLMAQTHEESGTLSRQSWHKCPVCGRSQLLSERLRPPAQPANLSTSPPWTRFTTTAGP